MDIFDKILGSEAKLVGKKPPPVKDKKPPVDDKLLVKKEIRSPLIQNPSTFSTGAGPSTAFSGFKIPKKVKAEDDKNIKRPADSSVSIGIYGPIPKRANSIFAPVSASAFKENGIFPVQMNMFEVDLSNCPELIERFHVDIIIQTKKKEVVVNGDATMLFGDTNTSIRRSGCWSCWKAVVFLKPDLFELDTSDILNGHSFGAYDCAADLYIPYNRYKGGKIEKIEFCKADLEGTTFWKPIAKMIRADAVKVTFSIQRNKSKNSHGLIHTSGEKAMEPENRSELIRFLEIATSQETNCHSYLNFGNATYRRDPDGSFRNGRFEVDEKMQLNKDGKEVRTGFEKSMRIVGAGKDVKIVMTIDSRRTAFYQALPALKFLEAIYDFAPPRNGSERDRDWNAKKTKEIDPAIVQRIINFMKMEGETNTNRKLEEMKTVAFDVTHMEEGKQSQLFIHSFDYRGAHGVTFDLRKPDGDSVECSVYTYFLEHHRYRLRYPDLPVAVFKRSKSYSFLPLEVLKVGGGQRVKHQHLSANVQQEMTGRLSLLPAQHVESYHTVLQNDLNVDNSLVLKSFGIKVGKEPFKMTARILPAPSIRFGGSVYTPRNGPGTRPQIISKGTKFVAPACIRSVHVVICDRSVDERHGQRLIHLLQRAFIENGCQIENPQIKWEVSRIEPMHEEIEKMMLKAKQNQVTLVLAITSEKYARVHDTLKLFEAQTGQQTAHLHVQTVDQLLKPNNAATLSNVMRKLNLKCGGLNFKIEVPLNTVHPGQMNDKFFKNTMFVGFELSHAGATCLFDKQNNIACGEPTVVGVSHSLESSTRLGGFNWLQNPREHSIQHLSSNFPRIFLTYYSACRQLPEKVVIYRSGMGEQDFERIKKEAQEMRECLERDERILEISKKPYKPKLVFVITIKTSSYRVLPQEIDRRGKSFDQNCPSGTCVETQVTSCGLEEFILISQSALIGTARPTRYVVMENDVKWTKNEIAHLTYFMAFGHQVSYQPPGVPDVLYAAENTAKRGRNNLKEYQRIRKLENYTANKTDLVEDTIDGKLMEEMTAKLGECKLSNRNFWA